MSNDLQGARELNDRLLRIASSYPKEMAAAMYQEALVEQREMRARCPVAPHGGALRASIIVKKPEVGPAAPFGGRDIHVRIEAGGPSAPYAIAVHEHLSEHSPPSWQGLSADEIQWNVPGTGPKFIEGPLLESAPHMAQRIASRFDANRAAKG